MLRFQKILNEMRIGFKQSVFRFLFRVTGLGQLLSQDNEPSAYSFFSAYMHSWWWNRLWFRLQLNDQVKNKFDRIISALSALNKVGIFNEVNCELIVNHDDLYDLASMLISLQQVQILDQSNFSLVSTHECPDILADVFLNLMHAGILDQSNFSLVSTYGSLSLRGLANVLLNLMHAGILDQSNFSLVSTHESPYELADALFHLRHAGILDQSNFSLVANHANLSDLDMFFCYVDKGLIDQSNFVFIATHDNRDVLLSTCYILESSGILDKTIFSLVTTHANPENLIYALYDIHRAGILTSENREVVARYAAPQILADVLICLKKADILTPENREVAARHADPQILADVLVRLKKADILTPENREVVITHANPSYLGDALCNLQDADILTPENREVVVAAAHANPLDLAGALLNLMHAEILTPENREVVARHADPRNLAHALISLNLDQIFRPEIREAVIIHADPYELARVLIYLEHAGILNQENLNALIASNHAALITEHYRIWARIPRYLLTQANFERLLTAAEDANPSAALVRIRDQIIGAEPEPEIPVVFNPQQSTHTGSVHRSVSASAVKLKSLYGQGFNLEDIIKDVSAFVNGLEDIPKHVAAKRCMARITSPNYSFNDSSSDVSTLELLGLAWLAIHDRSKCHTSIEDARSLIIEGLYEIQRGYNLDDLGNDLGGYDSPICLAGTFNKLMEKLNGIHQDVEVYYITHEGASSKFPKLIQAHAIAYLQSIASPKNATEYDEVKAILAKLKESDNLEPIWDKIKEGVQADLWDEFKEAYGENKTNRRFVEMINYGGAAELPDLIDIEANLVSSTGFQENWSLQVHSLWARDLSPSAQYNLDKQCGLIIIKP